MIKAELESAASCRQDDILPTK